jgi:hypothetical protein
MAHHTGKIEGRSGNNILIGGKQFYVPPEKVWLFEKYPPGLSVTVIEVKGTVSAINPLKSSPASSAPVKTIPKAEKAVSIGESVSPGGLDVAGDAFDTVRAHQIHNEDSTPPAPIPEGTIISVTIGGVLNLGNYSNVNLEVTANCAEAARTAFQSEIRSTVEMMQDIIKHVGVK